ncbi:phosphate/phosphite/phosphonate ABC transporter substrate-binding protein [Mannheimia granulomatis]|uniref:phosphate/phosphite/phosphonate ABC transporter substrate-binding protein n=1 Tax=Mannheimia granulomatis TaxID=85402 RepID=UPI002150109E|nr:phosphate/phosphite/phosphonate ABC transporter substrate-binding protein [Mannheimia granulomatis]
MATLNSPYQYLTVLKGKTLSAVDNDALGGFLLGYYEFHRQGMRQNRDFEVRFSGFPVDKTLFLFAENQLEAVKPNVLAA